MCCDGVQADGTGDGLGLSVLLVIGFCLGYFRGFVCGLVGYEFSDFEDSILFPVGFVVFDSEDFHFGSRHLKGKGRSLLCVGFEEMRDEFPGSSTVSKNTCDVHRMRDV